MQNWTYYGNTRDGWRLEMYPFSKSISFYLIFMKLGHIAKRHNISLSQIVLDTYTALELSKIDQIIDDRSLRQTVFIGFSLPLNLPQTWRVYFVSVLCSCLFCDWGFCICSFFTPLLQQSNLKGPNGELKGKNVESSLKTFYKEFRKVVKLYYVCSF